MTPPTNPRRGGVPARTGFVYKPRAPSLTQERAQRYRSGGRDGFLDSSVNTFTPGEGANWIRVAPPTWEDPTHYAVDLYFHYDVGPDENSYLCIEMMDETVLRMAGVTETVCGLCQEKREALQAGANIEGVRALDSVLRLGAWILNRKAEKDGALFWAFAPSIDREIIAQATDKHTGEVLLIDHPDSGYDIEFDRKGQGMTTKYTGVKIARRESALPPEILTFVVANPIPKVLKFYDQAYIMEQFRGPTEAGAGTKIAGGNGAAQPEPAPDEDDKIPHDAPASKAATPERVQPRQPAAAATPSTATPAGNAARRRAAAKPAGITLETFAGLDVNGLLDWADKHNLEIPPDVSDDDIPQFLVDKATELGIAA